MKKFGDQFHDTLHQTSVRREKAANERAAYAEDTAKRLNVLYARLESAMAAAKLNGLDAANVFEKARIRFLTLHQQAHNTLEQIIAEDEDRWYPLRDRLEDTLSEIRQEAHTLESIGKP